MRFSLLHSKLQSGTAHIYRKNGQYKTKQNFSINTERIRRYLPENDQRDTRRYGLCEHCACEPRPWHRQSISEYFPLGKRCRRGRCTQQEQQKHTLRIGQQSAPSIAYYPRTALLRRRLARLHRTHRQSAEVAV